jgi:TonB-dependent starch-binding outer membrane protein SusC
VRRGRRHEGTVATTEGGADERAPERSLAQGPGESGQYGARRRVKGAILRRLPLPAALLLLAISATIAEVRAQTGSIVGQVTDVVSGAPLEGAEVRVVGQPFSALARSDGRFLIPGVPSGPLMLRAHRVGYAPVTREILVPGHAPLVIDFGLSAQPLDLEGVVVTGVPTGARQREIGHTVTRLVLPQRSPPRPTLSDVLQGAAVGVEVTGGSGEAGQGKQIRLRGNRSMVLSNQPVIYVDGIRMMEGAFPAQVFRPQSQEPLTPDGANITTTPLDMVSVGDIERIEVVKGPAASTLFGTGSANGVIQIFTRRGRPGPATWTADVMQGTGWVRPFGVNGVDYLHVEHFLRDSWWGRGYGGGAGAGPCVTDDPRWEGANRSEEGGCRWPGAQWYQTYRLSVGGGGERFTYFVSGDYQNDTHALPLDRLERYGTRVNLGAVLTPRLEVQVRGAFTRMTTTNTISGNDLEGILLSSMRQNRNALSSADPRVIAQLLENRNRQEIGRFTGGATTTFAQSATLSHRLTLGYDHSVQDLRSLRTESPFNAGALTTRRWERGLATVDYVATRIFSPRPGLRSTLSLGGQLVADDVESRAATGSDADGADLPEVERRVGSTSNVGLFARNVLDLQDRYFLTLGLRADRHRTRGGVFLRADPMVAGAWVVSDESFWPESLGVLRLRTAYGRSRSAAGPFQDAVVYRGGPTLEDPGAGRLLQPEKVSEWEVGTEWATSGGRLSAGLAYYHQSTTDALVPVADPVETSPFRSQLQNLGRVRNHGVEFEVEAVLVNRARWGVEAGLQVTTNHSKVLDLGGAEPFRGLNANLIVGHPVPVSYGRRVADPDAINGPWSPDRYVLEDGVPVSLPLGPQLPTDFVAPSLALRLPGGIMVAAHGEYRGGNIRFVSPVPVTRSVVTPLCFPYYVDPGTSLELKADTPDLWQERCSPRGSSDYWFDGDYFKLRSVTAVVPVGFVFPSAVEEATLTVTLGNAWTWHRDVPWWDLEVLSNEGANDDGLGSSERVPASTTLTFGVRVRF